MKHLKAKLISATALLVLSAVMMTTASFAWFTISTNPEISNIQTSVGANGNLEIALSDEDGEEPDESAVGDAGKNIKWGNLVDLSQFTFEELKPVQFVDGTISAPKFGLDGRIIELDELTATAVGADGSDDFSDGVIFEYTDSSDVVWAYRVDFFMRSNVAGTVSLGTAADRGDAPSTTAGSAGWGAGSTITPDSNVSIVFYDGTNYVTATEDDTGALDATVTTLVANEAKLISMYIFIDGAELTNADLLTEVLDDVTINIQFAHDDTLVPLDVEGTDYGKPTT